MTLAVIQCHFRQFFHEWWLIGSPTSFFTSCFCTPFPIFTLKKGNCGGKKKGFIFGGEGSGEDLTGGCHLSHTNRSDSPPSWFPGFHVPPSEIWPKRRWHHLIARSADYSLTLSACALLYCSVVFARWFVLWRAMVTLCVSPVCRSCLVKYLEENNTCPTCRIVIHQSHPLQYIGWVREAPPPCFLVFWSAVLHSLPLRDAACATRTVSHKRNRKVHKEEERHPSNRHSFFNFIRIDSMVIHWLRFVFIHLTHINFHEKWGESRFHIHSFHPDSRYQYIVETVWKER